MMPRLCRQSGVPVGVMVTLGRVPDELVAARTPDSSHKRAVEHVCDAKVAVVDKSVADFIMIKRDELEQIYVASEHREHGVAQVLLAEAEKQIAKSGYREAWLAVVASNRRARSFYERAGRNDQGLVDYRAFGETGPIFVPVHRYTKSVSPGIDSRPSH